jgi:hypothetical protein
MRENDKTKKKKEKRTKRKRKIVAFNQYLLVARARACHISFATIDDDDDDDFENNTI